jgi:hypothetical protein
MYGPPEYPSRASSSPTIILLVSGLTGTLGFLLGFFAGMDSAEPAASRPSASAQIFTMESPTADSTPAVPDPASLPITQEPPSGQVPPVGQDPSAVQNAAPSNPPVSSAQNPAGQEATGAQRTLTVGVDIQPGMYRTTGPAPGQPACYWARMKDTSANPASIVAAGNPVGPATVTIAATDKVFQTAGCADWVPATQ